MQLNFSEFDRGIKTNFNNEDFSLEYPKLVWQSFPKKAKEFFIDNVAYLSTICMPLVSRKKEIKYNTSRPLFASFFRDTVINSIPHAVDDYGQKTVEEIKRFMNLNVVFNDNKAKIPNLDIDSEEKALVSFSCGKDSLLSLGVCRELNLNPVSVYINDTVSPTENKIKLNHMEKIRKEIGIKIEVVTNNIERLNDFETHNTMETCVGYCHMMPGFSFLALPFASFYKTKYIVQGNQQDMNFGFVNKEGYKTVPSYNQTSEGTREINAVVNAITRSKVELISVIEPLTNIAIMKVLFGRYKELAKSQVSCDCLDTCRKQRWCCNCSKCARLSLFMIANGFDPKIAGFDENMLNKGYKHCYALFSDKEQDVYEKSREAIEQQMLAFYMAYKRGHKGYMIDLFKKQFLAEAKSREDELHKKFFRIYDGTTIPKEIRADVLGIYREELD